ncbi:MAG: PTS mannitol transporter subunit IICB, partial [Roseburia sp.]|nr:PTS mannitol transporter subunit IICB [Roseburia sp.]
MKKYLHRFGKFYSRVMMDFIGIFIFIGILSVLFGERGWIPNEDIYAISLFVYSYVLPILVAYVTGNRVQETKEQPDSRKTGGVIAVMAEAGLLVADPQVGLLGAMLLGPCCGFLWKRILEPGLRRLNLGIEMLLRNLFVAAAGGVLAGFSCFLLAPVVRELVEVLLGGMEYLANHNLIFLMSPVIEILKVFFLNNSLHYGILVPLGMQQVEVSGGSVLFFLETNPGPGLGILLALFITRKEKRKEYASGIFAEFIGGIHEIYFPEVLANLWLLFAVIAGGTAGNLCFSLCGAEAVTAISPGSILTLLLMCEPGDYPGVLLAVTVSAAVAFLCALGILCLQRRKPGIRKTGEKKPEERVTEEKKPEERATEEKKPGEETEERKPEKLPPQGERKKEMIHKIGIICDAGVGSSAMGAALLRRKLAAMGIGGVEVSAYAADRIP